MAKQGDYIQVSSFIMANERPGQPILVFKNSDLLAMQYHYSGINILAPIPREYNFQWRSRESNQAVRTVDDMASSLAQVPEDHAYLWLVTVASCSYLGVDYGCNLLEDYIAERYVIEKSEDFYQAKVRLLRRRIHSADGADRS
jgi:hypothetical protein